MFSTLKNQSDFCLNRLNERFQRLYLAYRDQCHEIETYSRCIVIDKGIIRAAANCRDLIDKPENEVNQSINLSIVKSCGCGLAIYFHQVHILAASVPLLIQSLQVYLASNFQQEQFLIQTERAHRRSRRIAESLLQ